MNLKDAIAALETAVKEVAQAVLIDDLTQLESPLALNEAKVSFGLGKPRLDVVVFGDLNRFKRMNDEYGHDAGDFAISRIGELIQNLIVNKGQARAFRRSGDEFVILLSKKSLSNFKKVVKEFESCSFQFRNSKLTTSMSFGYAITKGEIDFDSLLAQAEMACQIAKSKGEGVCVGWSKRLEQKSLVNLRDRCRNCGTTIVCDTPKESVPQNRMLKYCPCCGKDLSN